MAQCLVNGAIGDFCGNNRGGSTNFYVINYSSSTSYTTTGSSSYISGITAQAGSAYEFTVPENTLSFTDAGTFTPENQTRSFNHSVTVALNQLTTDKRDKLMLLTQGRVVVIVKDGNGRYWALGTGQGLRVTAFTDMTGTASSDRNGYEFTLSSVGGESEMPKEIAYTAFSSTIVSA